MAPKAKRAAVPKSTAMNEETQLATRNEYKKLHGKLCYLAKTTNDRSRGHASKVQRRYVLVMVELFQCGVYSQFFYRHTWGNRMVESFPDDQ